MFVIASGNSYPKDGKQIAKQPQSHGYAQLSATLRFPQPSPAPAVLSPADPVGAGSLCVHLYLLGLLRKCHQPSLTLPCLWRMVEASRGTGASLLFLKQLILPGWAAVCGLAEQPKQRLWVSSSLGLSTALLIERALFCFTALCWEQDCCVGSC
jgi:hypothetical protein